MGPASRGIRAHQNLQDLLDSGLLANSLHVAAPGKGLHCISLSPGFRVPAESSEFRMVSSLCPEMSLHILSLRELPEVSVQSREDHAL